MAALGEGSRPRLSGQTALSAASLKVEMETAKHQAHEAKQEIRDLKARLARTLGDEVAENHPEHSVSSAIVKDLTAKSSNYSSRKAICTSRCAIPRKNSRRHDV